MADTALPLRLLPARVFVWLPRALRETLAALATVERELRALAPAERPARIAALPDGPLREAASALLPVLDEPALPFATVGDLLTHAQQPWAPHARLALTVLGVADDRARGQARAIAGALYLLDRLARLREDCRAGTPYLAHEEMARVRVTAASLAAGLLNPAFLDQQLERARRLLRAGSPLGRQLRGRAGFALRLLILAADRWIAAKRQSGLDEPPAPGLMADMLLATRALRHGFGHC